MCKNPLEVVYRNRAEFNGWNSQWVTTSSNSSLFFGFISSKLYTTELSSRFHKFILRSSADKKFSPSGLTHRLLIWYSCPFLNYYFCFPSQDSLTTFDLGIISCPFASNFLEDSYFFSFFISTLHSLISLSLAVSIYGLEVGNMLVHSIALIFSGIWLEFNGSNAGSWD